MPPATTPTRRPALAQLHTAGGTPAYTERPIRSPYYRKYLTAMTDQQPESKPEPLEYRTPSPSEKPPPVPGPTPQTLKFDPPVLKTSSGAVHHDSTTMDDQTMNSPAHILMRLTPDERKSPHLVHASRELQLAFNAPDFLNPPLGIFYMPEDIEHKAYQNLLACIAIFFQVGHSGFSASYFTSLLNELLIGKNLSPLTDDPTEWQQHAGPPVTTTLPSKEAIEKYGAYMFQNRRNSEAFTDDPSLRRYHLLSEVIPGRAIWAGRITRQNWNPIHIWRVMSSRVWKMVWRRSSPTRRARLAELSYKQRTTQPHLKPATPPSPRHAASKSTSKSAKAS